MSQHAECHALKLGRLHSMSRLLVNVINCTCAFLSVTKKSQNLCCAKGPTVLLFQASFSPALQLRHETTRRCRRLSSYPKFVRQRWLQTENRMNTLFCCSLQILQIGPLPVFNKPTPLCTSSFQTSACTSVAFSHVSIELG